MLKTGFTRNQNQCELSPLGAAIVESLPDQAKKKRIQKRFETHRECPVSLVFNRKQVEAFYAKRGQMIKATATKS